MQDQRYAIGDAADAPLRSRLRNEAAAGSVAADAQSGGHEPFDAQPFAPSALHTVTSPVDNRQTTMPSSSSTDGDVAQITINEGLAWLNLLRWFVSLHSS